MPRFVKVMPRDYKRMLQALERPSAAGLSGEPHGAFEEIAALLNGGDVPQ